MTQKKSKLVIRFVVPPKKVVDPDPLHLTESIWDRQKREYVERVLGGKSSSEVARSALSAIKAAGVRK